MRRALAGNPYQSTKHGTPGYGYFGKHAGYDYAVKEQKAYAPEAVTVINVWKGRENVDGGNIVEMKGKYTHRFLHMKSIGVKVGDKLKEGAVVGVTGNTGNVGYHLHHDTRKNGTAWNASYSNYIDWEKLIKGEEMYKGKSAKEWYDSKEFYKKKLIAEQKNSFALTKLAKIKDNEISRLKAQVGDASAVEMIKQGLKQLLGLK